MLGNSTATSMSPMSAPDATSIQSVLFSSPVISYGMPFMIALIFSASVRSV
ncbi:MAG: hypothetical protein IJW03_05090 [Clostridia bacterium]|nr:hypothetical protein [Clostridia bacterium]